MKIPRDVSGSALTKALRVCGYEITRQSGSHMRLTTNRDGGHHITIPNHSPIKTGTLSGILKSVAVHHKTTVETLIKLLKI